MTEWPRWFSWSAAARPAGPEPTTQTFFPDHWGGRRRFTAPAADIPADSTVLPVLGTLEVTELVEE